MSEENVHLDIINEDNPVTDEIISKVQTEEPSSGTETIEANESAIPEKYRGKSVEEIIDMHSNAERELSRLGNELGENRKLVDKVLQAELNAQPKTVEEELDWDYAPEQAAASLVQKEVGAIKHELDQIKYDTALDKFKGKYPDFDTDTQTAEFRDWVQASTYRTNLYNKNYNGIDLVAASELMDGWQDMKSAAPEVDLAAKRENDLKAASMEKGSSSGASRKNTWSRTYIRKLRTEHPLKYEQYKDEIALAYAEDRVTK